jgi:hypothetical protein
LRSRPKRWIILLTSLGVIAVQPAANDTITDAPPLEAVQQARFALAIVRERNKAFRAGLAVGVLLGLVPIFIRWFFYT